VSNKNIPALVKFQFLSFYIVILNTFVTTWKTEILHHHLTLSSTVIIAFSEK